MKDELFVGVTTWDSELFLELKWTPDIGPNVKV